ncbi:MAG: hypothetical protein P1P90_01800 [Patescibacteria group bacterium]|nr:hypothetical protein [Patescibacteria group bacterium]
MKKIWSVLLSILLGAFVVGIGTGYFLYLANKDRQALAQEANQAKLEAQEALNNSQKAIEEANKKLSEANEQVTNAQLALEAIQKEQALLKKAEPLLKPTGKTLDGWVTAISTAQGVSLIHPPGSVTNINDDTELSIIEETDSEPENTWLKIIPYSETLNTSLENSITSSTNISYFIDGKVVAGILGYNKNTDAETGLFKVYTNGSSTQLIWMQEPPPFKIKSWQKEQNISIKEILQTFEFQK